MESEDIYADMPVLEAMNPHEMENWQQDNVHLIL